MTIHATEWTMTSDITPEAAYRDTDTTDGWRLSWLPDRRLTRTQALAGMRLDELLSDPRMVHDRMAQARVEVYADELGILRDHAVILLAKRMAARLEQEVRPNGDPTPPGRGPRRSHTIEPPLVHG
ncbi:hypothetical protein OHA40_30050 [Nocardia sp. NBC_00508]|uniref:hypothetical protein n=1 Tax=Nocardia sp. NBC_00508 TaxID=2975992 RepID=UPI002E80508A|nr:hypothetical protein [Nocardia sp. NBC_00508]WUD65805.1 hypothetical protein OHA40_30050 [Nocardia sp. NBC_00508]